MVASSTTQEAPVRAGGGDRPQATGLAWGTGARGFAATSSAWESQGDASGAWIAHNSPVG
jgi:hypothetical protein